MSIKTENGTAGNPAFTVKTAHDDDDGDKKKNRGLCPGCLPWKQYTLHHVLATANFRNMCSFLTSHNALLCFSLKKTILIEIFFFLLCLILMWNLKREERKGITWIFPLIYFQLNTAKTGNECLLHFSYVNIF